jgi:histidyl-tRNA synthetase
MGKYGEEGDRLLFKVLNSGNYLEGLDLAGLGPEQTHALTLRITEKGLRYDLTVPFARFVVNHQNEIAFPFKRYQVQPVWRADKPQKGRYREFYQCDVDVIGSDSLLSEAELVQIIHDVFRRLNIKVSIRLNNRKILAGIADAAGAGDRLTDMTVAMDKLDKIGREKVMEELGARGFGVATVGKIMQLMDLSGSIRHKVAFLKEKLVNSEIGMTGIAEMETVLGKLAACGADDDVSLDLTLARGLNYYTGTIIEVKATETEIGSICGGGRYDDLTGIFGLPGVSGVGISFGADRIYDVLLALGRFPDHGLQSSQLLFVNFGEKEESYCMKLATELRREGIRTEIFPDSGKLKRQMKYADQKKIPFVALVGENEMSQGKLTVKNMETGEQLFLAPGELSDLLRK